jgi:predicted AAA+ superfamily ATPase
LGSASPQLIRQSSESLAGRLSYLELSPFLVSEMPQTPIQSFWERGSFPLSILPYSLAQSRTWRADYLRALVERDLPQLGLSLPPAKLWRLLTLLAHAHADLLNASKLGEVLGASHTTFRAWLDWLEGAFLVRTLPPWAGNDKKRLVKSPKVYLRDVGLWQNLLGIADFNALLGHPKMGDAWEGLVIEQIISTMGPEWRTSFYRTSNGAELDLVLERGNQRIGIECKASTAPTVTRGFWTARDDLELTGLWVVCPIDTAYPWKDGATIGGLRPCLEWLGGLV